MTTVWTVLVYDRLDGVYVFATEDDANAFALAVGDVLATDVAEQTVCSPAMAADLIAAEREDEEVEA